MAQCDSRLQQVAFTIRQRKAGGVTQLPKVARRQRRARGNAESAAQMFQADAAQITRTMFVAAGGGRDIEHTEGADGGCDIGAGCMRIVLEVLGMSSQG